MKNEGIKDPRQKVTFHTLHHTSSFWFALRGTPILAIKELMGHRTLAMTERYTHLIPDHKREAVNGLAAEVAVRLGAGESATILKP